MSYQNLKIKTCAVVQGNIRNGTSEVLECLSRHFDRVILSTWENENLTDLVNSKCHLIQSPKPPAAGYSHRNYQRKSSAAGIALAKQLGATHVLKWRTDMLPTKLNVPQLLEWSKTEPIPTALESRIVTCAFRNLSVKQDWFSTIPDLFAFGDINLMQLLWGDEKFDYSRDMNVPSTLNDEFGMSWIDRPDAASLFCAEAELYATFKDRLQQLTKQKLTHPVIACDFMRLIDHKKLGICWFGEPGNFRTITQALQHPWWTEKIWQNKNPEITNCGYSESGFKKKILQKYITQYAQKTERQRSNIDYIFYKRNLHTNNLIV